MLVQDYESPRFDVCVLLGRWLGLPVLATFQGGDRPKTRVEASVRPWTVPAAAGLLVGSRREARAVTIRYQLPSDAITLVANPIDVHEWAPGDRAAARSTLGLPADAPVACWHGRVEIRRKGLDILVEAWREVCAERPDVDLRLLLCGTGTQSERLRGLINATGLRGVHWRDEYVLDQADIRRQLAASDVFVLPSRHEGFAVAPMEAMACGRPVVACDASGIADLLAGGERAGGVIVPREDPEALAKALGRLLDDRALAARLGEAARRRTVENYSLESVGLVLASALHRAAPNHFPAPSSSARQNPRNSGRPRGPSKRAFLKGKILENLGLLRRWEGPVRRRARRWIVRPSRRWIVRPSRSIRRRVRPVRRQARRWIVRLSKPSKLLEDLVMSRVRRWMVRLSVKHMHGPKKIAYSPDELVVVCLVRDGRMYVRSFIDHYLSLGVKHIVFLDNGSDDDTVAVAQEHERVTVLQTKLPYKKYEFEMKHYLISRFGKGRWSLCVDIDELFDYPYSDVVGLSSLLRYLNERSYTAVVAQQLDMFPDRPLSSRVSQEDEPLKELYRFYDISNIKKEDYKSRRPHRRNVVANDDITIYKDGIRTTLFGLTLTLIKHPLIFFDGQARPEGAFHRISNARVADFSCVLYHYKLVDGLPEQAARDLREERRYPILIPYYEMYRDVTERNPDIGIGRDTAMELESVNELIENGFLVVSDEYRRWAEAEKENRVAPS
jgi:hypothetical protein